MEKLKENFKLFTYIFYPGIVLILYFAQVLEGKLGWNLIFCPTDLVFIAIVLFIYILFDLYNLGDSKFVKKIKRDDGRYKISFLFVFIVILVLLMNLYDDLKVYFYLNNDASISLIIVCVIWLILLGLCYLIDRYGND